MDTEKKEYLEKALDKGLPKAFGMHFTELEEGHACVAMRVGDEHKNVYGIVHGGVLYTLADTATGYAAATVGDKVVTVNGSMNYLTASPKTTEIICEANVVRAGSKIIVVAAAVRDESGMLLADGSYTLYVLG